MSRPLALDVDGTLIKSDLTHEMILEAIKRDPLKAVHYARLGLRSKPAMKQEMVARIGDRIATEALPLEPKIVELAKGAVAQGRSVHLCSGTEHSLVERLGETLDFVSESHGTSSTYNMTSGNKAAFLRERFPKGFDYAGNSTQDFAVWEAAQSAYAIHPPQGTELTETAAGESVEILEARPALGETLPHLLRGLEIWKLVAILVPVLIVTALTSLTSVATLKLVSGLSLLFLARNVERMLIRVQTDRARGGSARNGNAISTGDLSVPMAVIAYLGLGLAGLGALALLTPWLPLLLLSLRGLQIFALPLIRSDRPPT